MGGFLRGGELDATAPFSVNPYLLPEASLLAAFLLLGDDFCPKPLPVPEDEDRRCVDLFVINYKLVK